MKARAAALTLAALAVLGAGAWLDGYGARALLRAERMLQVPPAPLDVPPDRPARIVLLGTSLTAGGELWLRRVRARLEACRPGGVALTRVARPGAAGAWGQARLAEILADPPDLIAMEFTINDSALHRGEPLARAAARHEAMLAQAARAGVPVLLMTMSPAWRLRAWPRPGQVAYRDAYRALAAQGRAALLDTIALWRALPEPRRRDMVPDGLHPTDEAMAEIFAPALADALEGALCAG